MLIAYPYIYWIYTNKNCLFLLINPNDKYHVDRPRAAKYFTAALEVNVHFSSVHLKHQQLYL